MRVTAYCSTADLMIGDISTSAALDPAKYVADAADEIDSHIGFRYVTPISTETPPTPAPVVLLLKRLNAHLATGRLILAATVLQEDVKLNAYGQSLVDSVLLSLALISSGQMVLVDVPPAPGNSADTLNPHVPLVSNGDGESAVDAFYDRVANPNYSFVTGTRPNGYTGLF